MERLILITPRIVRMDQTPEVPARVDDPRFSRTPTQADYEERMPLARPVGGCARRAELAPVQPESSAPTLSVGPVATTPVSSPEAAREECGEPAERKARTCGGTACLFRLSPRRASGA